MNTAELIKEATRIANIRTDIKEQHDKQFWAELKTRGLEEAGPDNGPKDENGRGTVHPRYAERIELINAKYDEAEKGYEEAGVPVEYAISGEVICEVTVVTKWNGRRHLQNRFYIAKGQKRNGEIKRGRLKAEDALAKLG